MYVRAIFTVMCLISVKAGSTALHLAAQNGHNETARILLFAGCNASTRNHVSNGYSSQPVIFSCSWGAFSNPVALGPFSSDRQHLSYDACLEVRREIISSVL